MEPEILLPRLQQPEIGPHYEPNESTQHPHTNFFKTNFNCPPIYT